MSIVCRYKVFHKFHSKETKPTIKFVNSKTSRNLISLDPATKIQRTIEGVPVLFADSFRFLENVYKNGIIKGINRKAL